MPPAISRRIVAESLHVLLVFLMVSQIFSVYDLFIVAVTPISELVATLTSHHEMVEDPPCLLLTLQIVDSEVPNFVGWLSHILWSS
jgi:hypothetical protein